MPAVRAFTRTVDESCSQWPSVHLPACIFPFFVPSARPAVSRCVSGDWPPQAAEPARGARGHQHCGDGPGGAPEQQARREPGAHLPRPGWRQGPPGSHRNRHHQEGADSCVFVLKMGLPGFTHFIILSLLTLSLGLLPFSFLPIADRFGLRHAKCCRRCAVFNIL